MRKGVLYKLSVTLVGERYTHTTIMLTVCYINRHPARGYHYSETNACSESAASNKTEYRSKRNPTGKPSRPNKKTKHQAPTISSIDKS